METHGVGTDASMATHVSNIVKRGYVTLEENTRSLLPTPLGSALCHAYMLLDPQLVLPTVRAGMEARCSQIAEGKAIFEDVVESTLRLFEEKFRNVEASLHILPLMFAVGFSGDTESDAGRLWTKAEALTAGVCLDSLLSKGSAEKGLGGGEAAGLLGPPGGGMTESVQRQLEALGFGPPQAPPQPTGEGLGGRGKNKKNRSKAQKSAAVPKPLPPPPAKPLDPNAATFSFNPGAAAFSMP